MGKAGRFVCVGLPFALTVASLICILIVMFAGITSNALYMFKTNTKDLSISTYDLSHLTKREHMKLNGAAITGAITSTGNLTAADLGLYDSYTVSLWNYCYTSGTETTCTPAKFDWASNASSITTTLTDIAAAHGANFTDAAVVDTVKYFGAVMKWTQVVWIIAAVVTAVELVVGIFAFCSRIGSCCTFIVSASASVAVIAAAALSTALSAVVVGSITALNQYGVSASFNTSFLSVAWLGVAFSLGASFFWLFSICCCSAGHSDSKRKSKAPGEKTPYGAYQRVSEPFLPAHGHQQTSYTPPTQPVTAQRYEPYSHGHV